MAFALEHYLLAGQPRSALRLLAANEALLYDSGRETTIRRAIAAIPDTVVTGDLEAYDRLRVVPPARQPAPVP